MKNHNELLDSLAIAKNTIYKDCFLGSHWAAYYSNTKIPRADIVVINPSYTRFLIDIFEIKYTREDLLQDIRTEKYKSYMPYCHRFYYACKSGIALMCDLPDNVGLYVYNPIKKTWRCRLAAKKREIKINVEMLLSLIFYRLKNKDERYWFSKKKYLSNIDDKELKKMGKLVSNAVDHYKYCKAINKDYVPLYDSFLKN